MAEFEPAIEKTLKHEGGFFHNEKTGEIVNRGITLKTYADLVNRKATEQTIRDLTLGETHDFYQRHFWNPLNLRAIESQRLAEKVFDLGVNMGTGTAVMLLQRALTNVGFPLQVDGRLGPKTIAAANQALEDGVYDELIRLAEERYRTVAKMPNNAGFLDGWLNRLHS